MTDTVPSLPVPLSIDYTSRDYESLREDLIERVKARVPEWGGSDPADFGVAFIEAMAHMGDMLGYYLDRTASEAFIATAMRRESVIQHAKALGYRPSGYLSSSVSVLVNNTSAGSVTIPKGSLIEATLVSDLGTVREAFETTAALTLAAGASNSILLRHGETISGELIGVSTGSPGMAFRLANTPAVDQSSSVTVGAATWREVLHLSDYGPTDPVYAAEDDGEGSVTIRFGDGVSGAIPALHQNITATYIVGGGIAGNIAANSPLSIVRAPGLTDVQVASLNASVTLSNSTPAVGGTDPESNDQIRYAAPRAARAFSRAVTVADHAALALHVPGVGIANAFADDPFNVDLYIAPYRTVGNAETYPGGNHSDTAEMVALKASVTDFLEDKTLLGTQVIIHEPEYADVLITLEVRALDQYLQSDVAQNAMEALLSTFSYPYMEFEQTIYREQVESVLNQVEGVMVARVSDIRHTHGSTPPWPTPDGRTLPGITDVVWIFKESNVTLTMTGGVSV